MATKEKIPTDHDRLTKHQFQHKEEVADLLRSNLSKELLDLLDLDTLQFRDREFGPTKYRTKRHVDLLWSVKSKQGENVALFLHIEGQVDHKDDMAVRVLEYQVAIIRRYKQTNPKGKVPPIITLVLYSGEKEWASADTIVDIFTDFEIYLKYGLRSKFLIDIRRKTTQEILKDGRAGITELLLQGNFYENSQLIIEGLRKKPYCCIEEGINYIDAREKGGFAAFSQKVSKFDPTLGKQYNTMFETLTQKVEKRGIQIGEQRGIQIGKQEGIQEGIQKGIREILQVLRKKGTDEKTIKELEKEVKKH